MENKKIFSIPINPYISEKEMNEIYLPLILKVKDFLFDMYVTIQIPPFTRDAMGGIFKHEEGLIDYALKLQKIVGVPVSAVFNNICVPPTYENLELFVKNFKPLYDKGIRYDSFGYNWKIQAPIISERDLSLPVLNEFQRPEPFGRVLR